eukprot:2113096-Pyramimonas_sp.AAC.1
MFVKHVRNSYRICGVPASLCRFFALVNLVSIMVLLYKVFQNQHNPTSSQYVKEQSMHQRVDEGAHEPPPASSKELSPSRELYPPLPQTRTKQARSVPGVNARTTPTASSPRDATFLDNQTHVEIMGFSSSAFPSHRDLRKVNKGGCIHPNTFLA